MDGGEFRRTMRNKLGFVGDAAVLSDIFDSLDTDGSGCAPRLPPLCTPIRV